MTTIAYRDGVMAADTQVSSGDFRWAKENKVFKLPNGSLIGLAGHCLNAHKLVRSLFENDGDLDEGILREATGVEGLYVNANGMVFAVSGGKAGGWGPMLGEFFAEGSGTQAALTAMMLGCDAKEAVAVAAKIDTGTSEPVTSESLDYVKKSKRNKKR